MSDSAEMFDPYWEWLEIPPEDQPPTFYRLLGLNDFEDDLAAIDAAAKQKTAYLHPMAAGPNRESVQKLLSEVAKARRTLLGSEAKQAYDQSLQVEPPAPQPPPVAGPPVEPPTGTQHQAPVADGSKPDPPSTQKQGAEAQPFRPLRRKSLLNDWRVHAISASVLFLGAIVFVYYNNSKSRRVASVAAPVPESRREKSRRSVPVGQARGAAKAKAGSSSGSARDGVMSRVPPKPKKRGSGQSSLELMLAQDGLSMEAVKGPENAMRRGDGREKRGDDPKTQDQDALPEYASIELSGNWRAGLKVTNNFEMPLKQMFDEANLNSGLVAKDGKLIVAPTKPQGKIASLTLKGKQLKLGETVALKTSLNGEAAKDVRVGLIAGGLRLTLRVVSTEIEVRINNVSAGKIASAKGKGIVLALTRDSKDINRFFWIVQSGEKAVCGRGVFTSGLAKAIRVGVLGKCGDSPPEVAVAINEIAVGKLDSPVAFTETKLQAFSLKPK